MSAHKNGNIAISDDYIISTSDGTREPTESTGSTLFAHMKLHRDKIAQIDIKTGQTDTFGELLQRCIRTALHMSDKNVTREHIISLCTNSHMNSSVPYISTQFLGARIAPLEPKLPAHEITHLLNLVCPKIIFASSESVPTLEKVVEESSMNCEIVVFGHTNKHTQFSEFLKPHRNEKEFGPVKIDNLKEIASIHFSSGSGGLPKGICLSHYALLGQRMNADVFVDPNFYYVQGVENKITHLPTLLSYSSLYWSLSVMFMLSSVIKGFCILIGDNFDAKEFWNLVEKYKPTIIDLIPAYVPEMFANRKNNVDVQNIFSILLFGARASKQHILKIQEVFPQAYVTVPYGQTETGLITIFNPHDALHREMKTRQEKMESSGLPIRGTTYKVVDIDSNKNVGPMQRGELRIKSKFVMSGYYNQDSSEAFDEDGWLRTGDIAYYDEDFCFYIVDRIKEAFQYQGWYISPAFLENELLKHPAVKQAVVIGVPQEDGHHPMGLVVVNEGFQMCEGEIEKFVEDRVPDWQRLRAGVRFINFVPLTPTGKVKRRELRDAVLEGKL